MNNLKFDKTAIVIVEILQEDKPIEVRYVTIGLVGNDSWQDLRSHALEYLKDVEGVKRVKDILCADSEAYRMFLENNLNNYFSGNDWFSHSYGAIF